LGAVFTHAAGLQTPPKPLCPADKDEYADNNKANKDDAVQVFIGIHGALDFSPTT
jgi:hypothetical protein